MGTNKLIGVIIVAIAICTLGYGLFTTVASEAEITTKVESLTPADQKDAVNTAILNDKIFTEIETYRIFGKRPVGADASQLNRPNPFEGI